MWRTIAPNPLPRLWYATIILCYFFLFLTSIRLVVYLLFYANQIFSCVGSFFFACSNQCKNKRWIKSNAILWWWGFAVFICIFVHLRTSWISFGSGALFLLWTYVNKCWFEMIFLWKIKGKFYEFIFFIRQHLYGLLSELMYAAHVCVCACGCVKMCRCIICISFTIIKINAK